MIRRNLTSDVTRVTKLKVLFIIIGTISSLVFLATLTNITYSQGSNQTVYSTDSKPFGIPYQDWVAAWWNWTSEITTDMHPRDDPSRSCNVNQNGSVWFLPDALSIESASNPRICEVPAGKAIFIPVITGEMDNIEKRNLTDTEIIKQALACDNYSNNRRAEVDGVSVNGLNDPVTYRTNSSHLFNSTMVDNNIYNLKPGTGRGFADGWFLFIKPLPIGEHKIHVAGAINAPDPNCNSNGDVTWNIRVK
ncbi:MAG: hypothetical protein WBN72_10205 [Nitrososphaeraceae archaeon]